MLLPKSAGLPLYYRTLRYVQEDITLRTRVREQAGRTSGNNESD